MGRGERLNWTLFIDESGQWCPEKNDDFLIAGLLLRDDFPKLTPAALKKTMDNALPHVPWPWHAAHLNEPLAAPLWHAAATAHPDDTPWSLTPGLRGFEALAFAEAQDVLRNHLGEKDYNALLTHVAQKPLFDLKIIRGLNRANALSGQTRYTLQKRVRRHRSVVRGLLEQIERQRDAYGPAATVFVGAEGWKGEAYEARPDRYQGLLKTMLERVIQTLKHVEGHHKVRVSPLRLDVEEPILNTRVPLHQSHIHKALTKVQGPGQQHNMLQVGMVTDYGPRTEPGHVLVDYIANAARRHIGRTQNTLMGLEGRLHLETSFRLRTLNPQRPQIAAGTIIDALLKQHGASDTRPAFTQRVTNATQRTIRRWAIEQAQLWKSSLERGEPGP